MVNITSVFVNWIEQIFVQEYNSRDKVNQCLLHFILVSHIATEIINAICLYFVDLVGRIKRKLRTIH